MNSCAMYTCIDYTLGINMCVTVADLDSIELPRRGEESGDSLTLDLFLLQTITTYFSCQPSPPHSDY